MNSRDATHRPPAERSSAANGNPSGPLSKRDVRDAIRHAIVEAFYAAHDGHSIDWLLASPPVQEAFHEACRSAGLIGGPADWNRELLRIRKMGRFPKRGPLKKMEASAEELDLYSFAGEIAWRMTSDKFEETSLDEILCDPEKAGYFDRVARRFAPGFEASQYRWAALRLRKARRVLVEEVKKYHFVFATRDFVRFQSWRSLKRQSESAGIYLLRDAARQPLYLGHTFDVRRRLLQHAACRAVDDLVPQVSILTGRELPSEEYHLALKEDLTRRHWPRWNINLVALSSREE